MKRSRTDSPLLFAPGELPGVSMESRLAAQGRKAIAGCDEAGRGPLAGPVVAAAVILDTGNVPVGVNDSKKLTEKMRERLFAEILAAARAVSVVSISAEAIDGSDIRKASLEAMRRAVCGLSVPADHVLADGRDVPPGLPCPGTAIVGGDASCASIAAASIIAKVTRDRMMVRCASEHGAYGLDGHKGYGSQAHRDAIQRHGGVMRIHRFSFAPLKNA